MHSFQSFYFVVVSLQDLQVKKTINIVIGNDLLEVFLLQSAREVARSPCRIEASLLANLEALQHGKLRRQPLQLIGGQADMCNQQQLVQVAQGGQVLQDNTTLSATIAEKTTTNLPA